MDSATAKLRFFRIAFGAAGTQTLISATEARDIVSAMFQGRFKAVWEIERDLSRLAAKALFLALLCVEKAAPLGGTAMVMGSDPLSVIVSASKVSSDHELWMHLKGKSSAPLAPSLVQFPLLWQLSNEYQFEVSSSFSESTVELRLSGLSVEKPAAVV